MTSHINSNEIKARLLISDVLFYYGAVCANKFNGSWWCPLHESGGKRKGHKTPSLVAKDSNGTATCLSRGCFSSDDIFGVIGKIESITDFNEQKIRACQIARIPHAEENKSGSDLKDIGLRKRIETSHDSLKEKHFDYLCQIGISKEIAEIFHLKSKDDYILYPQIVDEKIVGYKGISITKNHKAEKKKIFFEGDKADIWGYMTTHQKPHAIIVEGEKDCMRLVEAIQQAGEGDNYSVFTITTGAQTVPHNIANILKNLGPQTISIFYDKDSAGYTGGIKLANSIISELESVTIYYFKDEAKQGYDITDFLNEGNQFKDLWNLRKVVLKKEEQTVKTLYKDYIVDEAAALEILQPDTILYTGYKEIDIQCPIIVGENSIIVGRTGKGKTVLGVNFVNGILLNNPGSKIVVFSVELKKKGFLQRLLSSEYDLELFRIRNNSLGRAGNSLQEEYRARIKQYIAQYSDRLLLIDDIHSIEQIESTIMRLIKINYVPNYILIDYANILSFKNLIDINKHIQISTALKFLAKEKNIHVQLICQANRLTIDNDGEYARTENLADSDQYGRDAFIVYSIKTSVQDTRFYINPTKNRNGKSEEEIVLQWNAKSGKIYSKPIDDVSNRL